MKSNKVKITQTFTVFIEDGIMPMKTEFYCNDT